MKGRIGTPTGVRRSFPKLRECCDLSHKGEMRLKWMDYIEEGNSVLKASRHFDIPEPTVRYWRKRYIPQDLNTLNDESKKPHNVRESLIGWEVKEKIIRLRLRYPSWGKKKIQLLLLNEEGIRVGRSRIQAVINHAGLKRAAIKRRYHRRVSRRHMYEVPEEVAKKPGGLVYMDVKHLTLPGGRRVYQFTAIDHATRLLYARIFYKITSESGKKFLAKAIKHFPFKKIEYVGSDNGSEFLGLLEKELTRREITHVFSSPRSPKQNPFVERVIRTTIDDVYSIHGTELNINDQQAVINAYLNDYNYVRPHDSLQDRTPIAEYDRLCKLYNS